MEEENKNAELGNETEEKQVQKKKKTDWRDVLIVAGIVFAALLAILGVIAWFRAFAAAPVGSGTRFLLVISVIIDAIVLFIILANSK